ncbi:MAG: polysaccharide pyruvyl transferase family protein, partial [Candidatus Paceibacterota bacterium]
NYGAVLQTLATLDYLKSIEQNVNLINLNKVPTNKLLSVVYSHLFHRNFNKFRNKYFAPFSTIKYYTDEDITHLSSKYNVFIAGSDQIWRTKNTKAFGLKYFIDFAENCKKISYASSFGVSDWEETDKTENVSRLLRQFEAISIREDSAVGICKKYFDVKAVKVVDPTLLMPAEYYRDISKKAKIEVPKRSIATFFLDRHASSKVSFVKKYAKKENYHIVDLTIPKLKFRGSYLDVFSKPVEEWLNVLYKSEIIITESYHCVLFALIFRKKFVCIKNKRRGLARLESILKRLDLMHLFIDSNEATEQRIQETISLKIDYDKVWETLSSDIEYSKEYLNKNL